MKKGQKQRGGMEREGKGGTSRGCEDSKKNRT